MGDLNVLLVEDDADLRFLIGDIFRDVGCSVRDAEHGQHALDLLEQWRPDVIVLDVAMPVMDGFTFLARKRQLPDLTDIPVIVVSATARAPIEGAERVFSKPVDANDLLHAVKQLAA
jgi:CheY-like chemotaxis protein